MSGSRFGGLLIGGVILILLGLLGLAIPVFTTQQTENVATLGDLKVQSTEKTPHSIPPLVSEGALVLGVVLAGVGILQRR